MLGPAHLVKAAAVSWLLQELGRAGQVCAD